MERHLREAFPANDEHNFKPVGSRADETPFGKGGSGKSKDFATAFQLLAFLLHTWFSDQPIVWKEWEDIFRHAQLQAINQAGDDTILVLRVREGTNFCEFGSGSYDLPHHLNEPTDLMHGFPIDLVHVKVLRTHDGLDAENESIERNNNRNWHRGMGLAFPQNNQNFIVSTNILLYCAECVRLNYRPSVSYWTRGEESVQAFKGNLGRAVSAVISIADAQTRNALKIFGSTSRRVLEVLNNNEGAALELMNVPLLNGAIVVSQDDIAEFEPPHVLANVFN